MPFALVGPVEEQPVLFDDTCYFISFEEESEAEAVADMLNSPVCQQFLASLVFEDAKRPITVELLQRLNIRAIAEEVGLADDWRATRKRSLRYAEQPTVLQAELVMDRPASKS